jgi:hypothetical protein
MIRTTKIIIQIENQTQKARRFCESTGGLSNDLLLFVKLDSYCFENNVIYIDQRFNSLSLNRRNVLLKTFIAKAVRIKLILTILTFMRIGKICNLSNAIEPFDKGEKILFVKGWWEGGTDSFRKKKFNIHYKINFELTFFRFQQNPLETSKIVVSGKVLGVHIRRGDYRVFKNGKYFFEDVTYVDYIRMVQLNDPEYKTILILSNEIESVNRDLFNFDNIYFVHGNEFEDYFVMAHCDLLIGPPSTFTYWANYIGRGTLVYMESDDPLLMKDSVISKIETIKYDT